jgi:hypothetical protein
MLVCEVVDVDEVKGEDSQCSLVEWMVGFRDAQGVRF